MVTLYTAPTNNGLRPVLLLEELGLVYTLETVDLAHGAAQHPGLLALNPRGWIPVLIEETPGTAPRVLTQSLAILMHLARRHGRFWPGAPASEAAFFEALAVAGTDVPAAFYGCYHATAFDGPNSRAHGAFAADFRAALVQCDGWLAERAWLAGPDITIADIALFPQLLGAPARGVDLAGMPHLARWAAAMADRPATGRALGRFSRSPRPLLDALAAPAGD